MPDKYTDPTPNYYTEYGDEFNRLLDEYYGLPSGTSQNHPTTSLKSMMADSPTATPPRVTYTNGQPIMGRKTVTGKTEVIGDRPMDASIDLAYHPNNPVALETAFHEHQHSIQDFLLDRYGLRGQDKNDSGGNVTHMWPLQNPTVGKEEPDTTDLKEIAGYNQLLHSALFDPINQKYSALDPEDTSGPATMSPTYDAHLNNGQTTTTTLQPLSDRSRGYSALYSAAKKYVLPKDSE